MKNVVSLLTILPLCALLLLTGCATKAQTGAAGGAGIGALAGQLIGGNTESTLIGAAVGTGAGYIIGNEMDKKHAADLNKQSEGKEVTHSETGTFGGTRWKVASITPSDYVPEYASKVVEFRNDGHVVTTTTTKDGNVASKTERYRVADETLILNDDGYVINCSYTLTGDRLVVNADKFTAVLEKLQ